MIFWKRRVYKHRPIEHNLNAAREIVPWIMQHLNPASVADVGCGIGTWLKVFEENGVADYVGVEEPGIDTRKLLVDVSRIHLKDLQHPFTLERPFDLAICLEVAEHLKPSAADTIVKSLVGVSKIILFSAAIPHQGGQNHLNEQWPTYWQKKFEAHQFYFSDLVRFNFWENPKVEWWYKQNMFLVCHQSLQQKIPPATTPLNVVHPIVFLAAKGIENDFTYR